MRGNKLVPLDLEIEATSKRTTLQEKGESNKRCRLIKEREDLHHPNYPLSLL